MTPKVKLCTGEDRENCFDHQRARIVEDVRRRTALPEHSFTVSEGDRIGVIGPNGSGKSTLLEMLIGRVKQTAEMWRFARHAAELRLADFGVAQGVTIRSVIETLSHERPFPKPSAPHVLPKRWGARVLRIPTRTPRRSPAAGGNALPLPRPWSRRRTFCSWMSPPTIWILRDSVARIRLQNAAFACVVVSHDVISWRMSRTRWWNSIALTKMARSA